MAYVKRPYLQGPKFIPLGASSLNISHPLYRGMNTAFFFGLRKYNDLSPYSNHIYSTSGTVIWGTSPMGGSTHPLDSIALYRYSGNGCTNRGPVSHVMWVIASAFGTLCGTENALRLTDMTEAEQQEFTSGKWSAESLKQRADDPIASPRGAARSLSITMYGTGLGILQQSAVWIGELSYPFVLGRLYQAVVTCDGPNTVWGYVNGNPIGTLPAQGGFDAPPSNLRYLCMGDQGDVHFNGTIIAWRTYNRTLSAAEVAQDYLEPFALLNPVRRRKIHMLPVAAPIGGKRPRITVIA